MSPGTAEAARHLSRRNRLFNRRRPHLLRRRILRAENISVLLVLTALVALVAWVATTGDSFDPRERDLPIELLRDRSSEIELYNRPLQLWLEGTQPGYGTGFDLGPFPEATLDADWQPVGRVSMSADLRSDTRMTGSQAASNSRFHPWPLRLSGNEVRPDQAARRGFHRWSLVNQAAQAASIQAGAIPHLNLTRRCRETAKEVNNTIVEKRPFRGMLVCADTAPNREAPALPVDRHIEVERGGAR
jgi:hypothetical protein